MLRKFSNHCEVEYVRLFTAASYGLDELRAAAMDSMSRQKLNTLFAAAAAEIAGHPMQDAILSAMQRVHSTYLDAQRAGHIGLCRDECEDTLRAFRSSLDDLSALRDVPSRSAMPPTGTTAAMHDKAVDIARIFDDAAAAIIQIAEDKNKSLDERMRLISIAKPESVHWTSVEWTRLPLGVKDSRIRQTAPWIAWRAAENKPDD